MYKLAAVSPRGHAKVVVLRSLGRDASLNPHSNQTRSYASERHLLALLLSQIDERTIAAERWLPAEIWHSFRIASRTSVDDALLVPPYIVRVA